MTSLRRIYALRAAHLAVARPPPFRVVPNRHPRVPLAEPASAEYHLKLKRNFRFPGFIHPLSQAPEAEITRWRPVLWRRGSTVIALRAALSPRRADANCVCRFDRLWASPWARIAAAWAAVRSCRSRQADDLAPRPAAGTARLSPQRPGAPSWRHVGIRRLHPLAYSRRGRRAAAELA